MESSTTRSSWNLTRSGQGIPNETAAVITPHPNSSKELPKESGDPALIKALLVVNDATCWIALVCIVLGIVGNCLVIFVYLKAKKLPVYKVLVLHLAITDLTYCFTQIFWTHRRFNKHNWVFGLAICKLTIVWPTAMSCSMFTITLIALERYRTIIHPFAEKWRLNKVLAALLFCWLLAFGLQIPFATRKEIMQKGSAKDCLVRFTASEEDLEKYVNLAGFLITYPVPLVIISLCYLHIGWHALGGFRFPGAESNIHQFKQRRKNGAGMEANKQGRKFNKLLIMLALVVAGFVLTTTPNQAMILWFNFEDKTKSTLDNVRRQFLVLHFLSSLVHLHSCINPVIYCISDRKFRTQLMALLSLGYKRASTESKDQHLLKQKQQHSTKATAILSSRKKQSPSSHVLAKLEKSAYNETHL